MMDSKCEMIRPYPSLEECGKPTTQGWRGAMGIIPSCQDCAARTGVSLYIRPLDALKRDEEEKGRRGVREITIAEDSTLGAIKSMVEAAFPVCKHCAVGRPRAWGHYHRMGFGEAVAPCTGQWRAEA